jgi:hypothetical protein
VLRISFNRKIVPKPPALIEVHTIGNINGSLYTIKVEWQDDFIGLGSDLQAWRLNDEAWDALFNVTIPNGFSAYNCPFLFTVPRQRVPI